MLPAMSMGQGKPADLVKHWTPRDWMVVGGGFVAFIFSFFDYVGASASFFGGRTISVSISAWHSFAILGLLLVFAAAIVWVLRAFSVVDIPTLPTKFEYVVGGAAGLGTLLILLRGVTITGLGLRFGGIVLILAGIVVTAGAFWASTAGAAKPVSRPSSTGGFGPPPTPPTSPE
jgi:hypothetical protein